MSNILFNIIKDKVYKDKEIREVSFNSHGKVTNWIFDFKSQGLSKVFLQEYSRCFWESFSNGEYENINVGGMETGAISLVAGISLYSPQGIEVVPFYVRKSRKKSDLANILEGDIDKNKPIILVDDIINEGKTIRKEIKILEDIGCKISAIFVCLRFRDILYYQDLLDKGIKIISIFELNDFSGFLPVKNIVTETTTQSFEKYKCEYKITLTKKPNLYLVIPKSAPLLIEEYIYMGVDDGTFFCIDSRTGNFVWKYKVRFGAKGKNIFSSPSVYKDKVIFGAYDGNVYCLNRFSGKLEWVFVDADWIGSSPCISKEKGVVYIGLEFGLFKKHGGIVSIDINTGKVKWKNYTMAGLTHASPEYNKKYNLVVCGCNDGHVYAFNIKTGDIIWKFKTEGEVKYGSIFDNERGFVIVASMDGFVYVLCVKDGSLYFKFEARAGFYSTPIIKNNYIIIGSLDKNVYCFNLVTKKTEWVFETNGRVFASPVVDNRSIFIGSNDGRLYELDIVTGEVISLVLLSERIVNKIQIGYSLEGKRVLYVPTHACELYKIVEK